jgi:chemotaxis family two-component system sensor kinase Cph1
LNDAPGIAREFQTQIFQAFKRLHGPGIPGSGMGLAVCRRIVEHHGGKLWVESEVGNGAAFFFTVPFGEQETARRAGSGTLTR